ncbi:MULTISPECIES: hypothetical protein [Brevibacterium]|uniref:hypothetical protein n=1 Tax=Brevibacterium TaxID=1696 RepID=UPI0011BF9023|nr:MULTISPECIES: hypothetical protein [Brevibacterium]
MDEKQLRRRIECVMINAQSRHGGDGTYRAAAQAVIDDLGLTVRSIQMWADTQGQSGVSRFQVVGRVEEQG